MLAVNERLLLGGTQAVPGVKILANPGFLLRRQAVEALVVPEELLLLLRWQTLKPFDRFGWKRVGVAARRQSVGQFWPRLRAGRSLSWRLALGLRGATVLLRARGAACKRGREACGQHRSELESQLHQRVSGTARSDGVAGETFS